VLACVHPPEAQASLFPATDYLTGEAFRVARCTICSLVRTLPQPSAGELVRYYPGGYYGQGQRYNRLIQSLLNCLYGHRAARIERACGGHPGRVLDVGCGPGHLLRALRQRGWQTLGTEMTERSAAYARNVLGLDVRSRPLQDLALPDASFDAVVVWHVLEHLHEPDRLAREISRILKAGGLLFLGVPNFGSLEARLTGPGWFHLDVPRHLTHFTSESLRQLLTMNSLRPAATGYCSPEYDAFSLVQSLLNAIGLRHNLLYDLLRTRGAKLLNGHGQISRLHIMLTLLAAPMLIAGAAALTPLLAGLGLGGTVTIEAFKECPAS